MKYVLVALLGMAIVVAGLPTLNVNHNLHLPNINQSIDPFKIIVHSNLIDHKTVDITMNDEIGNPQTVKDIVDVLRQASSNDVINFHLVGLGGNLETVHYLLNNMHSSKAVINIIVEGNVYSGHAYLAALGASNGGTLTVKPNTVLMFHTFSGYGYNCNTELGTDRTVSNQEHCEAMIDSFQKQVTFDVESIAFLTPAEKKAILTGHDVYLQQSELANRMKNGMDKANDASSIKFETIPTVSVPYWVYPKSI